MSLKELTAVFFRIGNLTFGGGDPTIAALQRELLERRRWLTREQFAVAYSLARITPGTNLLAFCAATGAQMRRWAGAAAAVFAVTLPSALLAVLLTRAYDVWKGNPPVMAAVAGAAAAAVGMMGAGVWLVIRPHVTRERASRTLVFVAGAFALAWWVGWSPIQVLAVAALAGFFWREPDGE